MKKFFLINILLFFVINYAFAQDSSLQNQENIPTTNNKNNAKQRRQELKQKIEERKAQMQKRREERELRMNQNKENRMERRDGSRENRMERRDGSRENRMERRDDSNKIIEQNRNTQNLQQDINQAGTPPMPNMNEGRGNRR